MRTGILALAALVVGTAVGGSTVALWTSTASTPMTTISAGGLDITGRDPVWRETSSDVRTPGSVIDPRSFLVRQGDTVTMTQAFDTELRGDNMTGQLSVDWANPSSVPRGVDAVYDVTDTEGRHLGKTTELGSPLVLDGTAGTLGADDAGRKDTFTVTISLDFSGLADRVGPTSAEQLADLGRFSVDLDQVRQEAP